MKILCVKDVNVLHRRADGVVTPDRVVLERSSAPVSALSSRLFFVFEKGVKTHTETHQQSSSTGLFSPRVTNLGYRKLSYV